MFSKEAHPAIYIIIIHVASQHTFDTTENKIDN